MRHDLQFNIFVKTKNLTPASAQFFLDFKESVDEVNLAKAGKLKLKTVDEFLDEL